MSNNWVYENRHEFKWNNYIVKQLPSIFTRRHSEKKYDISVWFAHGKNWGARIDGVYYNMVAVLACEDRHIIRGRIEAVPPELLGKLDDLGFMKVEEK